MRLARAMRRKAERSAAVGELQAVKSYAKAKKAVRHATTHEIVMQAAVRRQAVVEIMATIVVAMHRSYGWGMDRLLRLRKKMRVQMECLKGRYVKLEEMEKSSRMNWTGSFALRRRTHGKRAAKSNTGRRASCPWYSSSLCGTNLASAESGPTALIMSWQTSGPPSMPAA